MQLHLIAIYRFFFETNESDFFVFSLLKILKVIVRESHCQRFMGGPAAAEVPHVGSTKFLFVWRLRSQPGGETTIAIVLQEEWMGLGQGVGPGSSHLGGGRGLHGGQDAHHLGSLRGRDVLGHVHDGIHGDLRIGLDEAAIEEAEKN